MLLSYPLPRLLCFLCAGIGFGVFKAGSLSLSLVVILILVNFFILLLLSQTKAITRIVYVQGALSLSMSFLLGLVLIIVHDPRYSTVYIGHQWDSKKPEQRLIQLTGRVDEEVSNYPKAVQFRFNVEEIILTTGTRQYTLPSCGNLIVMLHKPCPGLLLGDRILLSGRLQVLADPPSEHAFNRKVYLGLHRIFNSFQARGSDCQVLSKAAPNLKTIAYKVQQTGARLFTSSMKDSSASSFLSALLLGARANIDPDLYRAFSITGTVHIISVSGLHVQIVYAVFAWLVPVSRIRSGRKWLLILRRFLLVLFIWFYALLSGFSPAVVRSAVMISFFILAEGLPRKLSGSVVYFSSAMCILTVDPWALVDMGFQLSYLAVGSLLAFQKKIRLLLKFKNKLLGGLWNMFATALAAQVLTLPVCLFYFHQYPLYFLFANLVIIPITSLMLYTGILQLAVCFAAGALHLAALTMTRDILCNFMGSAYELMSWFLLKTASFPFSSLRGYYPTACDTLLMYLFIAGLLGLTRYRMKKSLILSAFILCYLLFENICWQLTTLRQEQRLQIKIPGTRIILLLDGTKALIVSGKLEKNTYRRYILPELEARGIAVVYINKQTTSRR